MDDADRADTFIETVFDDGIAAAMRIAADIPAGVSGDCDFCGDWFGRLIDGACGRCRDFYKLG